MRKTYKDAFLKKHNIKLGFMSAFVKAAAYALSDQPAVNAGTDVTLKDCHASLCGVQLCVSLHVLYQVTGSVCGEEKDSGFSIFQHQTSKPTATYLLPLYHPDLFKTDHNEAGVVCIAGFLKYINSLWVSLSSTFYFL